LDKDGVGGLAFDGWKKYMTKSLLLPPSTCSAILMMMIWTPFLSSKESVTSIHVPDAEYPIPSSVPLDPRSSPFVPHAAQARRQAHPIFARTLPCVHRHSLSISSSCKIESVKS